METPLPPPPLPAATEETKFLPSPNPPPQQKSYVSQPTTIVDAGSLGRTFHNQSSKSRHRSGGERTKSGSLERHSAAAAANRPRRKRESPSKQQQQQHHLQHTNPVFHHGGHGGHHLHVQQPGSPTPSTSLQQQQLQQQEDYYATADQVRMDYNSLFSYYDTQFPIYLTQCAAVEHLQQHPAKLNDGVGPDSGVAMVPMVRDAGTTSCSKPKTSKRSAGTSTTMDNAAAAAAAAGGASGARQRRHGRHHQRKRSQVDFHKH